MVRLTGKFPGTVDQMLAAAASRVIVAQTPWLTELRPADPFKLRMCADNYHIHHDGGHDPRERTISCICCPAAQMPTRATSASFGQAVRVRSFDQLPFQRFEISAQL
jgi:hypothetical protein